MTKHLLSLSLLAAAGYGANAQNTVLLADTAMTTHSSGANRFSALWEPNGNSFGYGMNQATGNYVAEDFTVPAGATWAVDSVIVYGYQTQAASNTTSTFTGAYAMLYNGVPGGGGTIIGGDSTTNRLGTSTYSGIQRVDTVTNITGVAGGGYRLIMRTAMRGFTNTLSAGTYWVAWGTTGTAASGPWEAPKVLAGSPLPTNPANQNGRVRGANGVWGIIRDSLSASSPGAVLGYNFMLKGRLNPTSVKDVSNAGFKLNEAFPNPASGSTNISFSIAKKSRVSVRIMNAAGQQVATVVEDEMTAGEYMIPFSTSALASGMYRIMLQTENGSTAMPLTVK